MKRHVALFLPSLEGGGAERAFVDLANQFVDLGNRVDLVLVRAKGPYLCEVRPEVRVVDLQGSRTTLAVLKLFRYLRENRPDAIISCLETANMTSMIACMAAGCSKIATLTQRSMPSKSYPHQNPLTQRLLFVILRLIYARARLIISNSHAASDDLWKEFGIPLANLAVIHNAIDMVRIERLAIEDPKHPWTILSAKPLLLSVGSLRPLKGFSNLLRAFAIVRKSVDCNLVVLGEGTERNRLEALAQETGIVDSVQFLGFDANPFRWMSKAAILISSSITESCPNVIQQALACGTPIVATDCPGGTSEILEGGKWGRLVPVASPQAMADAIIATLKDKDHPVGRMRAADFDPKLNAQEYLKLVLPESVSRNLKHSRAYVDIKKQLIEMPDESNGKCMKPSLDIVKTLFGSPDAYLLSNSTLPARVSIIKRMLFDQRFENYLEVGCGDGSIGLGLLKDGRNCTLLDFSPYMIERAINKTPPQLIKNVTYITCDACLYHPLHQFDLVLCIGVLAHVESVEKFIAKLTQLTKPNGLLLIQFTDSRSLWFRLNLFFRTNYSARKYTTNDMSFRSLMPIFLRHHLTVERMTHYSDSGFGLSRLNVKIAAQLKIITSFIGLKWFFSENLILLRKN